MQPVPVQRSRMRRGAVVVVDGAAPRREWWRMRVARCVV